MKGFSPTKAVENSVQNVESFPLPDHKIVGEALKTYIIVEQGEALIFIDKHAAHERMIFDRLKQQKRQIMSQGLLCPVTLRVSGEDGELLEKNGALLSELGFELEPFGENEYILRAVPADMLPEDAKAAVEEICEKLRRGKAPDPAAARDEILHTVELVQSLNKRLPLFQRLFHRKTFFRRKKEQCIKKMIPQRMQRILHRRIFSSYNFHTP